MHSSRASFFIRLIITKVLVLIRAPLQPSRTSVLTQAHHLILIILAPRKVLEAVHVTSDGQTVIRRGALPTLCPFVYKGFVLAFRLIVTGRTLVKYVGGERILDEIIAERVFIVYSDVPARFYIIFISIGDG